MTHQALIGQDTIIPQACLREERSDALSEMCTALGLSDQGLIAVLTVYLDESYNQLTSKNPNDPLVYTVGCWLSTPVQWKKFSKKWQPALNDAGVEWFHMSDYESRLKEYAEWPNLKRIGVLKRLHEIIKEHTLYGTTVSVNCAAYDEVVIGSNRQRFGKTYYSFDVRMVMAVIAEWANENNYHEPIHYVFAELKGQGNELDKIFRSFLKDPVARQHLRLTSMWSKGLMRDVHPLQAADIVAYEANKRAVNHVSPSKKFVRLSLDNLGTGLSANRIAPLYFGKNELIHLMYDVQSRGLRV